MKSGMQAVWGETEWAMAHFCDEVETHLPIDENLEACAVSVSYAEWKPSLPRVLMPGGPGADDLLKRVVFVTVKNFPSEVHTWFIQSHAK